MFRFTAKKLVAFLLAVGCSTAFAFPPPSFFCDKQCVAQDNVRGSLPYQECMAECLSDWN